MFHFTDKKIVFYEKPGCSGNAKQKRVLKSHNFAFEVKNILNTPWTKELLLTFFQELPKEEIVNLSAPQFKSNQIDISRYTKETLIDKMIQEPILIKRPLLEIDNHKVCGFDVEKISTLLGINLDTKKDFDTCTSTTPCTVV